jgi:hypothetical protein
MSNWMTDWIPSYDEFMRDLVFTPQTAAEDAKDYVLLQKSQPDAIK